MIGVSSLGAQSQKASYSNYGVPANDEDDRWGFIYLHLWQVMRAMSAGIPVVGYLYWSLLDNYEWADGWSPKFGLIAVNRRTQERIVHQGELYRFDMPADPAKPYQQNGGPLLYFGGTSEGARAVCAEIGPMVARKTVPAAGSPRMSSKAQP